MPNVIREPKGALRARQREIVKTLSRHGLAFLVDRAHARDASPSRPEHGPRCQSHGFPPPPWMSANVATAATLPGRTRVELLTRMERRGAKWPSGRNQ
jgi:hypothetical protein